MAIVTLLNLARPGLAGRSLPASSVVRCFHFTSFKGNLPFVDRSGSDPVDSRMSIFVSLTPP